MQFRIRSVLVYTGLVAVVFAVVSVLRSNGGGFRPVWLPCIFMLPLFALPSLFERVWDVKKTLTGRGLYPAIHALGVSLLSFGWLLISSLAFQPQWKGSKGMSWLFYVHDLPAAVTVFPAYLVGAFAYAVAAGSRAGEVVRARWYLVAIWFNAFVSLLYVLAVLFMNFAGHHASSKILFVWAPGVPCIAYTLMGIAIFRRRDFPPIKRDVVGAWFWFTACMVSLLAKVPIAMSMYARLPDQPRDGCFVVTAASRGHGRVVRAFYCAKRGRTLNQQLLSMWELEACLLANWPRFHQCLRRVYNVLGPMIASAIRFRWQADIVYWLLKPIEWLGRLVVRHYSN